jgi:hypothetical protein
MSIAREQAHGLAIVCALVTAMVGHGSDAEARSWRWVAFFDPNSAVVLDRAFRLIHEFVAFKNGDCPVRIELTGHIDGREAQSSQVALDFARAYAITEEFKRVGTPAWTFKLVGRGFSQPLVQTPVGVADAQNRRVELHFYDALTQPVECEPPLPPGWEGAVRRERWIVLPNGTKCQLGI